MGKVLFKTSKIWNQGADAGGEHYGFHAYINGYYDAAKHLVQIFTEKRTGDTLFLFYPICFNYRHFIELSLKYLIIESERCYFDKKESVVAKIENEHSLETLLNQLIKLFDIISDEKFDKEIKQIIIEFHNMDPNSEIFRYPFKKKGRILYLPEQKYYNIENIGLQMEKVSDYFDGIGIWLDENIQAACEMRYEFQQDMAAYLDNYL